MTQRQIDHAVADAIGESLGLVRNRGFTLLEPGRDGLEPEDLVLAVDCPYCRQAVAYPGAIDAGVLPLAECERCDVYFAIESHEIHARATGRS